MVLTIPASTGLIPPANSGTPCQPTGAVVSVEGLWGAGKTTIAQALGKQLTAAGFSTSVLHYGIRHGVQEQLSRLLEEQPLRRRTGIGGFTAAHHATVDLLLRLCREADNQRAYRDAARSHQIVIVDHGIYGKLAYCLTVLAEQHPDTALADLLTHLRACTNLWWLHPDLALHLDTPWPLARERAIARGHGGGNPAAVERLLFLPRFDTAYRAVLAEHPTRVRRIRVGLRPPADVAADAIDHVHRLLRVPGDSGDPRHEEVIHDER